MLMAGFHTRWLLTGSSSFLQDYLYKQDSDKPCLCVLYMDQGRNPKGSMGLSLGVFRLGYVYGANR